MKTAMILAAGRGERLKPLTDHYPKAMCLVQQKPIIEHHVSKLSKFGFERIVINHAYLGGQIRRHLGTGAQWNVEICYAPEPPGGLETGGGICNALPLLGKDPFLTINADVLTDYDFKNLALTKNTLSHLVLVPNPPTKKRGDFGLIEEKITQTTPQYTFAGIAYYQPEIFHWAKIGRYSVVPLLRDLIEKKQVSGEIHAGLWIDIGSLDSLQVANSLPNMP